LGVSSGEFLEKYTYTYVDEVNSHPFAVLKVEDDDKGGCPFISSEGCGIYEDRPSNCRYYPIGQGLIIVESDEGPVNEEFYFFIRDPNCLGYQGEKEWTIGSWRIDQGADLYDEMNREWKEIQLRRNTSEQSKLDSRKQSMLYMASYDIDKFKKFVFESKLLDILEVDKEEIEKIQIDEIALMKFGFKYLKYILMLEETLQVKEEYKREERQTEAEDRGSPL
ncbi:MAG: YkgJ family cysteine cluster protein, partial [Thermodesulfobacteriota bacterium]|nr:YkgJ family cysteine cluster protein [Thermodesulfobacteriota bacterium]